MRVLLVLIKQGACGSNFYSRGVRRHLVERYAQERLVRFIK